MINAIQTKFDKNVGIVKYICSYLDSYDFYISDDSDIVLFSDNNVITDVIINEIHNTTAFLLETVSLKSNKNTNFEDKVCIRFRLNLYV